MHKQPPISISAVRQLHIATNSVNKSQSFDPRLLAVYEEFSSWRSNKKSSSERIPEELWKKIFALEDIYPATTLRQVFAISIKQYRNKSAEYNFVIDNEVVTKSKELPQQLCQIKMKTNPYEQAPLPSAKTLVVEFCRNDGKIMKIHTTQDSIPTLMMTFFKEE